MTRNKPEAYFRERRQVQHDNKELQGKEYDKRQKKSKQISDQKIAEKHEPDIFRIPVTRLIPERDRWID